MNLGMALREKGESGRALEHLRRVAAGDPNNAGVHYELGQTLRQSGDLAGAVAAFEKALEIDPELREGYYALGQALKQQSASARKPRVAGRRARRTISSARAGRRRAGELSAAREQLTEALRLDDNHAEAHNLLGFMLGQQGDLPSALAHLERAIALQPESADAHYNLGVALWYSGSKDRAVTELRESVTLDPAAGASHAFLGTALRERGDLAGRAGQPAARHRAAAADRGRLRRSRHHLSAGGRARQGAGPARSRAEPPVAVGARRRTGTPPIAGLRQALAARRRRPAEAHNVLGLLLGRKARRQHRRWRPSSARPFGCGRTSPKPTTISASC